MLCRDFEIIACDLAEEFLPEESLPEASLLDARMRERGLRHAAECPNCAAKLTAERALTQGLQALSKSDENLKAPAHLKVALRAAFDRQVELSAAPTPGAAPVWKASALEASDLAGRWRAPNWLRWSLAAATMVLLGVAVALFIRNPATNSKDISKDRFGPPNPKSASTPAAQEKQAPRGIERKNQPQKSGTNIANLNKRYVKPRTTLRAADREFAAINETVTDYIPLTYLADATAVDGGIVVRVELSRSALLAMGLPIGMERTETRVKADMIVGDDGVARAVRFVR